MEKRPTEAELLASALEGARRAKQTLAQTADDLAAFSRDGSTSAKTAADALARLADVLERGPTDEADPERHSS